MARVLFLDTETTGLPLNLPLEDERQPRLTQVAFVYHDERGDEQAAGHLIVNPGVDIPEEASKIHGITNEVALRFGVPEKAAVGLIARMFAISDFVVAHSARFDLQQCAMAAARAGFSLPLVKHRCTAEAAAPVLNLPPTARMREFGHGDKPKTPKLEECHLAFFDETIPGAHNALFDVRALVRVYYELERRGCWAEEKAA